MQSILRVERVGIIYFYKQIIYYLICSKNKKPSFSFISCIVPLSSTSPVVAAIDKIFVKTSTPFITVNTA